MADATAKTCWCSSDAFLTRPFLTHFREGRATNALIADPGMHAVNVFIGSLTRIIETCGM